MLLLPYHLHLSTFLNIPLFLIYQLSCLFHFRPSTLSLLFNSDSNHSTLKQQSDSDSFTQQLIRHLCYVSCTVLSAAMATVNKTKSCPPEPTVKNPKRNKHVKIYIQVMIGAVKGKQNRIEQAEWVRWVEENIIGEANLINSHTKLTSFNGFPLLL